MTDKPTPTTDLLKRCAEIHEWRSTGVLSGEALRDYAKRKWPGRLDTLQMAEHETVTEALALLAKWGQPAQAAESRTIPDREIAGIVERALQELEGLVKYVTSTYCHWDMRRAKGALSDLEWWARRKLAAHAQAAEPVAWAFKYDDGTWHDPSTTEHSSGMRPLFAAPQPVAREPLTDEQIKALMQAHRTAMLMTCKAKVPECGEFAAIAQDLDWLCESFGIKGDPHGTE